jgi:hypothetical protein
MKPPAKGLKLPYHVPRARERKMTVSATKFSAAVSTIAAQAMAGTSGGRLKASATKEMTGRSIGGRRAGHTDVSIVISGRNVPCPAATGS